MTSRQTVEPSPAETVWYGHRFVGVDLIVRGFVLLAAVPSGASTRLLDTVRGAENFHFARFLYLGYRCGVEVALC